MKKHLLLAAVFAVVSTPVLAQDVTSASGSASEANSGSISGASSNGNQQSQANIGGNNAGIGSSTSESASGAVSGSNSESGSVSDQSQGQALQNSNQVGATNQQGVNTSITFNSRDRKINEVRTNASVPLAASSSFSSDYCGGTASGGASVAPIGLSIGGAGPVFDDTCRYIRLAQTGGMMAANWHNMGEYDMRNRMMAFATWSTCMAGPQADKRRKGNRDNAVFDACIRLGLLGSEGSPVSPPAAPAPEPKVMDSSGHPTPEAVERYKTPRGDLQYESNPVVQVPPVAMAVRP